LSDTPILRGPNWNLPFHISVDAYDSSLGVVLGQKEGQQHYAIYFINKNLTPAKLNYTVTEKEFLAVNYAINKFCHYITGYEVFVHTNHSSIQYIMNKPITNGRITRWLLLLQEFNVIVIDRPGKENQVADFISRLNTKGENVLVFDEFLDEHLFSISTHTPWFADISNYLATGKLRQHLSSKKKQRIIQLSSMYSWMGGDLYKTRPDLIIQRCVIEDDMHDILKDSHDGPCGGHFSDKRTIYKILHSGYCWSTLFRDPKKYVRSYDSC
jgi:hypothetical protein